MDTRQKVELICIIVFVAHYCSPCLRLEKVLPSCEIFIFILLVPIKDGKCLDGSISHISVLVALYCAPCRQANTCVYVYVDPLVNLQYCH